MEDLEKGVHIPELYDLQHRNDKELHNATTYKENVIGRSVSNRLFENDKTAGFLDRLQPMVAEMISSTAVIRNWFNWTVSKYYDRHSN